MDAKFWMDFGWAYSIFFRSPPNNAMLPTFVSPLPTTTVLQPDLEVSRLHVTTTSHHPSESSILMNGWPLSVNNFPQKPLRFKLIDRQCWVSKEIISLNFISHPQRVNIIHDASMEMYKNYLECKIIIYYKSFTQRSAIDRVIFPTTTKNTFNWF